MKEQLPYRIPKSYVSWTLCLGHGSIISNETLHALGCFITSLLMAAEEHIYSKATLWPHSVRQCMYNIDSDTNAEGHTVASVVISIPARRKKLVDRCRRLLNDSFHHQSLLPNDYVWQESIRLHEQEASFDF